MPARSGRFFPSLMLSASLKIALSSASMSSASLYAIKWSCAIRPQPSLVKWDLSRSATARMSLSHHCGRSWRIRPGSRIWRPRLEKTFSRSITPGSCRKSTGRSMKKRLRNMLPLKKEKPVIENPEKEKPEKVKPGIEKPEKEKPVIEKPGKERPSAARTARAKRIKK